MVTLLLTFFILLVALADTQEAGLVGAGRGPLIRHVNAKGEPGIMPGRLEQHRQQYKRDAWWIPSHQGDPDQLTKVKQKLEREIPVKFKPGEASVSYEQDKVVMRLPARMDFIDGQPVLTSAVSTVLGTIIDSLREHPNWRVRINGDVPANSPLPVARARTKGVLFTIAYCVLGFRLDK